LPVALALRFAGHVRATGVCLAEKITKTLLGPDRNRYNAKQPTIGTLKATPKE